MSDVIIPPSTVGTTGIITDRNNHHHHGHPIDTAHFFNSQAHVIAAVAKGEVATEKTGAASTLATNVASGTLGVAIEKTSAANQLATNVGSQAVLNLVLQQSNAASVQAEKIAAANQLTTEKIGAAAALLAVQNQAAALAQAAECCCELKELIRADGEKTRDLVAGINAANLATQLVDAKQEILALRVRLPLAA